MILREWSGRASQANPNAYATHFRNNVLPALYDISGFLGACLSQRQLNESIEFLVLMRQQSFEATKHFAGNDISGSIVEPGAVAALLEYDATTQHYEVIEHVGTYTTGFARPWGGQPTAFSTGASRHAA